MGGHAGLLLSVHSMADTSKAQALGQQLWGNGRNLIPNSLQAQVQRSESRMLVFKQCPEICGTIKRASSSHLERQAGNVHCAPALRQCLAVELKPVHRHSLKYCLSLLCSLMLLPCAGTRRCTKPAHLWNGSTGNCRLLGWLLSSCFSYDITAFKLQKGSISELKTHGSFHKSKGEMLAGHGAGGGHSGTAEHAEHPVSPVFC